MPMDLHKSEGDTDIPPHSILSSSHSQDLAMLTSAFIFLSIFAAAARAGKRGRPTMGKCVSSSVLLSCVVSTVFATCSRVLPERT